MHVPLPLYAHFLQPIFKLLNLSKSSDKADEYGNLRRPWAFVHPFTNISVTTVECSIVCPRHLVQELFVPLIEQLDHSAQTQISISDENFLVIQIGGEGLEAGQRVLDLTAPLALAGM